MIRLGRMRPSRISYASPLRMVPKKGTMEWRPLGDYHVLNAQTLTEKYPIPCIADFISALYDAKRFHRHYKSFIKAHENTKWSKILPIVLLGIRTALKENIEASCAELVYGTTPQLPSGMIETSIISPCDDICVERLRNAMVDSVKPPLCQPYTGPHKVLKRTAKTFTIDLNGRKSTVFINRAKPAYFIPTHEDKIPTLTVENGVNPIFTLQIISLLPTKQ
ncbi:integrase catalytic domain-containing protein [Trichonephila clavipes]|nr:integrase catalytic domain-containing protein [Trichonephila clavipes]